MEKQKASNTVPYTVRLVRPIVTDIAVMAKERGISARTLVRLWIGERMALEKKIQAQELRTPNAEEIERVEQHPPGGNQKVSAATQAKRELEVRMVAYVDQFRAEGKTTKAACEIVGIKLSRYKFLKSGSTKWFEEFKM